MLPTADLLAAVLDHQRRGAATADCARAFHDGIADRLALAAIAAARATGETRIALTGGCFLNRILLGRMRHRLIEAGLQPLVHRLVPPGDGGLALGQALVAARTGAPV
jgi:hydrogenase maturation protein HypF